MSISTKACCELVQFIRERYAIYQRREAGQAKPWTSDPVLRQYRFTNVYREDDKVTRWISENWRTPHAKDPDVFFAMAVARLLNLPASLEAVGYPVPWNPARFKKILRARKEAGDKIFNGAYMIHADATETGLKTDYLADFVLMPMWEKRAELRPRKGDRLEDFHQRLMTCRDMGSFMAAQVAADVKYVGVLRDADDWWRWAASGPGSRRGLNRIVGRPVDAPWKEHIWLEVLNELQSALAPLLKKAGMPRMHAQDVQGIGCCEWDKVCRVRLGEGRPKQLYPGG